MMDEYGQNLSRLEISVRQAIIQVKAFAEAHRTLIWCFARSQKLIRR